MSLPLEILIVALIALAVGRLAPQPWRGRLFSALKLEKIGVKMGKRDFVGRDALQEQKAAGVPRATIGLRVVSEGRHIPRPGFPVVSGGEEVGVVTSGTFSPTAEVGIALARVSRSHAVRGGLGIRIREREVGTERVKKSFV